MTGTDQERGTDREPGAGLRTDVPHPARVYDFYLGGKDNFAADREAAAQVIEMLPHVPAGARANRRFLGRAVRFAAADLGIRQYLDLGTGIPTANNTHEVAQRVHPDARVVYVDNDPIVLAHARALLRGTGEGRTAYVDADVRDLDRILDAPETAELIDFDRPVALLAVALLHFVPDGDGPGALLDRLKERLPSGSALILSHATGELMEPGRRGQAEKAFAAYTASGLNLSLRGTAETAGFLTSGEGWSLVEPGVVPVHEWRADGNPEDAELPRWQANALGGVAVRG